MLKENKVKVHCNYNRSPYRIEFLNDLEDLTLDNDQFKCSIDLTISVIDAETYMYAWRINSPSGYRMYDGNYTTDHDRIRMAEFEFTKALYTCLCGDFNPNYKPLKMG